MGLTARQYFEAAREAARDAERIGAQLAAIEERALSTGGGLEGRVHATGEPDRIGRRVATMLDQTQRLELRREEDYRAIDAACEMLYGEDNRGGLYALVGWPADAIYHHYLSLRTWPEVARMMGYSERYLLARVAWALDLMDANGQMWTRLGRGMAES